ncbi:MAG: SMP-30/gluconolactonase/LRE family protein [Limisphaerales bacterium]
MRTKQYAALAMVWALLVPTLGNAKDLGQHGPPSTIPSFIPFELRQAEFPEGVAVDKVGNVYVSVRTSPFGPLPTLSDQVWKFSPSGARSLLADFGPPRGGACGLAVDACGTVYMARTLRPYNGVYRVGANGGVTLVPGTEQIVFPDGLAFDPRGNLFITESFSLDDPGCGPSGDGGIWRVPKGGTAELWLRDELLTGACPPIFFSFPVGANGVAFYHRALYSINTDKTLVVRIPVRPDGSPGQPEVWKQVQDLPESPFYQSPAFPLQLDGLALDVRGNVYIAVPSRNAIVRIHADDRSQETIAIHPDVPLDAPLSLAFGTGKGNRECLFVINGGFVALLIPELPWPDPGLVKIEVGIPGLPLP